jgi:cytochrome c biogenesis protein CcmG, thiol:disulfide interchange protein DsbE
VTIENTLDAAAHATVPANGSIARRSWTRRITLVAPLVIFGSIAIFLAIGLTLDPRKVPSPLIGKPVPAFSLPPVRGRSLGLASSDLKGQVSLVNVFASWCVACREEHPLLMQISRSALVPVHGLNYKDQPADAARWLDEMGDPYMRTGADLDGRVAIDWGVYGVPETFVIDAQGRIAYKQIGAITPSIWNQTLLPLIRTLQAASL